MQASARLDFRIKTHQIAPVGEVMKRWRADFFVLAPVLLICCSCGGGVADDTAAAPFERASHSLIADQTGNADCAHFCKSLPPGRERGQCESDAAHGGGLCLECGGNIGLLCGLGVPGMSPFCCSAGDACSGVTCCGVACADLRSDALNCGACGSACPSLFCGSGACCAPGTTAVCNGKCTNTTNDVNNCGQCNVKCPTGETCTAGVCCAANVGSACGSCGGAIQCNGSCSVPTPPNFGATCQNACHTGTIQCDGTCNAAPCP